MLYTIVSLDDVFHYQIYPQNKKINVVNKQTEIQFTTNPYDYL